MASAADRQRLVDEVHSEYGELDALVNNAGIAPRRRDDLIDATEESFDEVLQVNLAGPHFLTQAVARRWLAAEVRPARPRSVVFVTSISAEYASTARGEYCISKAGLSMSRELWAARLAEEDIAVYEVRPGIMRTDMTAAVTAKYDALIADGLVPQRRWGHGRGRRLRGGVAPVGSVPVLAGHGHRRRRRLPPEAPVRERVRQPSPESFPAHATFMLLQGCGELTRDRGWMSECIEERFGISTAQDHFFAVRREPGTEVRLLTRLRSHHVMCPCLLASTSKWSPSASASPAGTPPDGTWGMLVSRNHAD